MKRNFLIFLIVMFVGSIFTTNIYSTSCFSDIIWVKDVSASKCTGTNPISCSGFFLAGEHKCCQSGSVHDNCVLGDRDVIFTSYTNGTCQTLPCTGFSGGFCVSQTPSGDLEPAEFWVPNDYPNGTC